MNWRIIAIFQTFNCFLQEPTSSKSDFHNLWVLSHPLKLGSGLCWEGLLAWAFPEWRVWLAEPVLAVVAGAGELPDNDPALRWRLSTPSLLLSGVAAVWPEILQSRNRTPFPLDFESMLNLLERGFFPRRGVRRESWNEGSLLLIQENDLQTNPREAPETSAEKRDRSVDTILT